MSYCRFGEADAYIFASTEGGFECCACIISHPLPFSFTCETEEELLLHITKHRIVGDYIPESVDAELLREISVRDTGESCNVYVSAEQKESSFLASSIGIPVDQEPPPPSPIEKAIRHLREREQHIPENRSEDFYKGYVHALRELEFYNEVSRVLPRY